MRQGALCILLVQKNIDAESGEMCMIDPLCLWLIICLVIRLMESVGRLSVYDPDGHVFKHIDDFFTEAAPEIGFTETHGFPSAHGKGAAIFFAGGFDNFQDRIPPGRNEAAGYVFGRHAALLQSLNGLIHVWPEFVFWDE